MKNRFVTDWNCNLLPGLSDCSDSVSSAVNCLELLRERAGFNRFCFLPEFDPDAESVSGFLLRIDHSLEELRNAVPPSVSLIATASVRLVPELYAYRNLRRLFLPSSHFLPVSLPPIPGETTEVDLANLVRKGSYRVLVTNAQLLTVLYPKEVRERIFRLPGLAFLFSYGILDDPSCDVYLKHLAAAKVPVLFGSSVRSFSMAGQFDRDWLMSIARERLPDETFRFIMNDRVLFRV